MTQSLHFLQETWLAWVLVLLAIVVLKGESILSLLGRIKLPSLPIGNDESSAVKHDAGQPPSEETKAYFAALSPIVEPLDPPDRWAVTAKMLSPIEAAAKAMQVMEKYRNQPSGT